MGIVVSMKELQNRRPTEVRPLPQGGGNVVLFTGVRYERWADEANPNTVSPEPRTNHAKAAD